MPNARSAAIVGACLALAACAAPQNAAQTGQSAPQVALPALPPPGEPKELIGLSPVALQAQFGAPAFVRKDGPNALWRFDAPRCKAFFFFYPQGGTLAVRHVETIPRGSTMAADAACLNALKVRGASS